MHRTLLSPETLPLAVTVALALLGTAAGADFPDVSKLPSRPTCPIRW